MTLIGQGSMGGPVGVQLARHGAGTRSPGRIRAIDGDVVELRNLIGTDYRVSHIDMPKAEAAASIIREINPSVNLSFWNHKLDAKDMPEIVALAHQTDLLGLFADEFGLMMEIADACHELCPQIAAIFGPRCDYAEVAFSVPRLTAPITTTLGQRKRQAIAEPQALGCDTAYVANFVSAVCLRLLLVSSKGNDLLDCFANAPLHIIGLRPSWVFEKQPRDLVRSIYRVEVPTKPRNPNY